MNRLGVRTASVRAKGLTRLLEMSRHDFEGLLRCQPVMAYEMLSVLSERLTSAHNASIRDLQEKNRLLYTDGVLDARDSSGETFGMERLIACLPFNKHQTAQEICDHIWQAVDAHPGTVRQYEDITLVCVRRRH